MRILGEPQGSSHRAMVWAAQYATPFFVSIVPIYWELYRLHGGVDPEVAVAQAAHETGWGGYGRAVTRAHNNFCGLKIASPVGPDSNPDDHMRFPTEHHGVAAHLDHLALYAGSSGYPRTCTYDSRHFKWICGKAQTVEQLSGSWAPSPTYAEGILRKASELKAFHI